MQIVRNMNQTHHFQLNMNFFNLKISKIFILNYYYILQLVKK